MHNHSGAKTEIFHENSINAIAADAHQQSWYWLRKYKQNSVFHVEGVQLSTTHIYVYKMVYVVRKIANLLKNYDNYDRKRSLVSFKKA